MGTGTAFMARLAVRLQSFVETKVRTDPLWVRLAVLYSGHDAPGEGEHKIAAYIREQTAARAPDAAPVRHCLYGLDADLIMLGCAHRRNPPTHTSFLRLCLTGLTIVGPRGQADDARAQLFPDS
jgi:5'-3' exonuclease